MKQRNDVKTEKRKWYLPIFARHENELASSAERCFHFIWNLAALLLSSMALCGVCLNFAIGRFQHLLYIYIGYFRNWHIFLLNWIPLLLLQLLFYALFNRQWVAFLLNSLVALLTSIGNYYKLIFRSEPFSFADMTSIRAGLSVAGEYDVRVDWRIAAAIAFVLVAVAILFFFARARMQGWKRIAVALMALAAVFPLWHFVYSSSERYYANASDNYVQLTRGNSDSFISNGFFYPFLYSITQSANIPPESYDQAEAAARYDQFQNAEIPAEKRVNLMVLQLESFCDLSAIGLEGLAADLYEPLHQMQAEGYSGTLIPSVFGGGTVVTERNIMTGSFLQQDYFKPSYSYVRYLASQGYSCTVSHPNVPYFYARNAANSYLGFREFYHLDNYFQSITNGEWRCDASYLPEVFRMFRSAARDEAPVFAYNVTLQGHSPYRNDGFDRESDLWIGDGVSDTTRYVLNNYLSMVAETQRILQGELEALREEKQPCVIVFYGDHKPWLAAEVYRELGLSLDFQTEQAMIDYLGTPYVIWANDAAKEIARHDITGDGPMISPGYLMNLLFDQLGWEGPALMQYTRGVMAKIPVICTMGAYVEDGNFCTELSAEGTQMLEEYQNLLYYVHYRPELAEMPATDRNES